MVEKRHRKSTLHLFHALDRTKTTRMTHQEIGNKLTIRMKSALNWNRLSLAVVVYANRRIQKAILLKMGTSQEVGNAYLKCMEQM